MDFHSVLTSDQVSQRDILWLPPYEEILSNRQHGTDPPVFHLTANAPARKGLYNHPILILSRPANSREKIYFLALTSFHHRDLISRFRGRDKVLCWERYLALAPCADHPLWAGGRHDPMYSVLTFEGREPTRVGGYVNVADIYEAQWCDVERFWPTNVGAPFRTKLDQRSFEIVLKAVRKFTGWQPGEQTGSGAGNVLAKLGECLLECVQWPKLGEATACSA